ncbi:MAG: N-acetyl-gamma-glutamyl-phosphate reductase, partial [Firmicutes bacterium]|nr:N-acetyl-gamma-glutamyl-phosphate reductase [Bacillota bacterium]
TSTTHAGRAVADFHPQFTGLIDAEFSTFDLHEAVEKTDIIFCALPHGKSAAIVVPLLEAGAKVIDLSADFRLKEAGLYPQWYNQEHPSPHFLPEAVYGLPELKREQISKARLIANPGCYPTASILALAPLAKAKLVDWKSVVLDAKSGVSGAGRSLKQAFHFPECTENFKAYKVPNHQHIPEIEQELGILAGSRPCLSFTPHLVPMVRGILITAYVRLTKELTEPDLWELYEHFYEGESFIRLLKPPRLPETRFVMGTNFCDLSLRYDQRTGRVIVFSAIDNLVKGASGQAVQNMNIICNLPEEQGLKHVAPLP